MKITGVRTRLYEFEMGRPLGDANLPKGSSRAAGLAIFLDTDEGVSGVMNGSPGARSQIHGIVDDVLVGEDPRGVRGLWKKMVDRVFKGGNRGAAGKRPRLMIDSNEYLSPKQAIRQIRRLEERFDLFWVEEPARRWDYRGLRQVSRAVSAAVATGENLQEIGDFMPLVANEAVDVVQVGQGTSGITGAMQVADLAYGFELPVAVMNCPGNFMAHLAAALPNHLMMEVVGAGREVCFTVDTRIEDGDLVIGDTPGLGMVFDEEKLGRLEVDRLSPGLKAGGWGRRRGAGLYEVLVGQEPEDR